MSFDGFQADAFQADAFQMEAAVAAPGLSFQWGIYRQQRDAQERERIRLADAAFIAAQAAANEVDAPVAPDVAQAVAVALKQYALPDGRPYFESIAKMQAAIRAADREARQFTLDEDAAQALLIWLMH